jgi:quercetin dioxygenase-like cupin family protein
MKNLTRLVSGVLLAVLMLGYVTKTAMAQDVVKVAPEQYKVLLENDRVRVLEYRIKPGEKSQMHSHPANILYSFSDSKGKVTTPDGKTTEADVKAGEAVWNEAGTHAVEIVGTTEAYGLIIELKDPQKK